MTVDQLAGGTTVTVAAALLDDDPPWLIIAKAVVIFTFLMLMTVFMIWFERRVVGRMQHRLGPNRTGPFGLLQTLADGAKLVFKEDLRPAMADKWVFALAPIIAGIPAFLAFSVIPLGGEVSIFGERTLLQLVDLEVGVLVVLAAASVGVYGIVLAGWASGSAFPLLSAMRSAAQVISYEIALGLAIVAVVIFSRSLSTTGIVEAQQSGWYIWLLPVSFVIYLIAAVGETNRAPFDLPEAESELVGGFHTEYSSMRFGLFYVGEYINMVTVGALATTLFLGGYLPPWPFSLIPGSDEGWITLVWFLGKLLLFMFGYVWLRGTLPRLRYDQFMKLGWKVLVPVSLVWTLAVAAIRVIQTTDGITRGQVLMILGGLVALLLVIAMLIPEQTQEREDVVYVAGEHPVPPLDLEVPDPRDVPRRVELTAGQPATTRRSGGRRTGETDREDHDGDI